MKNCIKCGGAIENAAKFCGFCGEVQPLKTVAAAVKPASVQKSTAAPSASETVSQKNESFQKRVKERRGIELESFSDGIYGNHKVPQRTKSGNGLVAFAVIALIAAVVLLTFLGTGSVLI